MSLLSHLIILMQDQGHLLTVGHILFHLVLNAKKDLALVSILSPSVGILFNEVIGGKKRKTQR